MITVALAIPIGLISGFLFFATVCALGCFAEKVLPFLHWPLTDNKFFSFYSFVNGLLMIFGAAVFFCIGMVVMSALGFV